jgi:hypothetical protein
VGAAETQTGPQEAAAALQRLLDTGVITDEEYEQLRGRVSP